ncbi:MAG: hypothetical protein ACPG4M_01595 [Alphaproteobacteria bacterium]
MLPWDGVVNLLAALGVAAFAAHTLVPVRRNRFPSLLEIRFGVLAVLLAVFLALRGFFWISDVPAFLLASQVAVSWVPLGIVLAVEGLLRRHAPLPLKLFPLVGGVASLILSFTFHLDPLPLVSALFAGFQILGLVLPFAWAFVRDRRQITNRENRRVDGMFTLTLVVLPLIATDFADLMPDLPLRMGAVAILLFAHAAVLAARFPNRNPVLSWRMINLFVLALLASGLVLWLSEIEGFKSFIRLAVLILTLALVLSLILELLSLRDQSEERALLRLLSALDMSRPEVVVNRLNRFSPFEGAKLVYAGQGPIPANFDADIGRLYGKDPSGPNEQERQIAAVLDSLGADFLFKIDPGRKGFCVVEVQDPTSNTRDWAQIVASLVQAKAA